MCQTDKMERVEVKAIIKYLCKKGMSPKEIQEDFLETFRKESPSYRTERNGMLNLGGRGRALKIINGLGAPKGLVQMKTLKLCTVWSCVTGGETCEI